MKTNIQKWGNSLALRIPKSFAVESNIEEGSEVDIFLQDDALVIKPSKQMKKFKLKNLINKISKDHLHTEIDTGAPVGKEIW